MNSDQVTEALRRLQQKRAILAYSQSRRGLRIWSPGRPVDRETRRIVRENAGQLLALMHAGDIRTCPAPDYHRRNWRYAGQDCFICGLCEQFEKFNALEWPSEGREAV